MQRRAIRYYSMGDVSGYSLAAVAYVRGLVNAGAEVEWIRILWAHNAAPTRADSHGRDCPLLEAANANGSSALADLPRLVEMTSRPVNHTIAIVHATPDYWPGVFAIEPQARHVGMTVWETDRPPAYWMPLLDLAHRIVVPCRMNREDFMQAQVRAPVHVVPHIRQHARAAYSSAELSALRSALDIDADRCVFYSINASNPRKAMPDLIDAFVRAFAPEDKVTLLLKTAGIGQARDPFFTQAPTQELVRGAISDACARADRKAPSIRLINRQLDDRTMGMLHEIGHCFVSLSHGEGWGLGAFEAATIGKPVIMTGWSAPLDYMIADGGNWPGAVPYSLVPAAIFPVDGPSYFSSQRWAQPDIDAAAALMQRFFDDGDDMRRYAQANRVEIVNRFAEPVVTQQLLDAIDG